MQDLTLGEEQPVDLHAYLNNNNSEGLQLVNQSPAPSNDKRSYADMEFAGEATPIPEDAYRRMNKLKGDKHLQ